jgi:transposase
VDTVIADKVFDAEERVLAPLRQAGNVIVLPPKSNRTPPREYDQALYSARHLMEHFVARLKQVRALATRYEKRAANFLGTSYLAASMTWLN